ncbi:metallophosphoesterase [Dyadobacter sp. CY261]|uniref:metallophosphoesterase n=1 Tax=Dyadobacter sp. CY261 TaxID=2907203 RepID=UPI001F1BF8AC|nr:metallophosphoesterase [Dyadobacter sp. CY261]MCF0075475.1 metallophosphoesterase [Dyadobacter sp. CY261]
MREHKHDWTSIYRQYGVRNITQLVNKTGGIRATGRLLHLNESTIRHKIASEETDSLNKPQTIFYFTDTHVQPKLETDHLGWIAKHIKEINPDYIINGGDFADAESLCSHILPHTLDARQKPSLKSDIACMEDAMLMISELSGRRDIHVTLGNHEERIWTMEKNNPDLAYLLQERFDGAYEKAGWTYTKFGVYHTLCGVDFTHAPMMMSGKPVGGKLSVNNVASNSVADCVYGHTHMKAELSVKKFGPDRQTTAINGGCSMPIGYIPKYVQGGSSGWWHGVIEIEVQNGRIQDTTFISLEKLKKLYA